MRTLNKLQLLWKTNQNHILTAIFLVFAVLILSNAEIGPMRYDEVDSYVLPIVSLQYRGSIIVVQEDIDRARNDLSTLYANVYGYDDLRLAKLCKIDDDHWMAYYFPVYALICLPAKIALQFMHLDQTRAFALTNALLFISAMWYFLKNMKDRSINVTLISMLLLFSPAWIYIQYIGAETMLFAITLFVMTCWKQKRYKTAAFFISIGSMANPVIMFVGICIFFEYLGKYFHKKKEEIFCKETILEVFKLGCCYLVSLVPFICNLYYLGVLNPTLGMATKEGWLNRFLAYLFDLNLGAASISVFIVILFILSIIYAIFFRKGRLLSYCAAAILTIAGFSVADHINCGMLYVSRYVFWIWPVMIFCVNEFLYEAWEKRKTAKNILIAAAIILQIGVVFFINGLSRFCFEFSNVSKILLDHYPQYYISFCASTFNSRTNHIDGGDLISDPVVYCDSKTDEIRKILYTNDSAGREQVLDLIMFSSEQKKDAFTAMFPSAEDGKYHYINIDRYEANQYYKISLLYHYVEDLLIRCGCPEDRIYYGEITENITKNNPAGCEALWTSIHEKASLELMSGEEFVHWLYLNVLGREEAKTENASWIQNIKEHEWSRKEVFGAFLSSAEFRQKYGLNE